MTEVIQIIIVSIFAIAIGFAVIGICYDILQR
jgi:hypothetical protein